MSDSPIPPQVLTWVEKNAIKLLTHLRAHDLEPAGRLLYEQLCPLIPSPWLTKYFAIPLGLLDNIKAEHPADTERVMHLLFELLGRLVRNLLFALVGSDIPEMRPDNGPACERYIHSLSRVSSVSPATYTALAAVACLQAFYDFAIAHEIPTTRASVDVHFVHVFYRYINDLSDKAPLPPTNERMTRFEAASHLEQLRRRLAELRASAHVPEHERTVFVDGAMPRIEHPTADVSGGGAVAGPAGPDAGERTAADVLPDYIDMDQAAALVNRSKKTLERALHKGRMPQPDIEGGGGKKHEWIYSKLRPWLEENYYRKLPERPRHIIR